MTMTSSKPSRAPTALALKIEELNAVLDQRVEEPGPILDALVSSVARGQPVPELWNKLHQGALRDDKLAELAFAYEGVGQDRRVKLLPVEQQVEIYLHAVDFFEHVFQDLDGAISYAERALGVVPNHPLAVERLAALLKASGYQLRLARLYLELAGAERDRDQQLALLRQAAELAADPSPAAVDLAIEVYQRILRVDPADAVARDALESRLLQCGRPRDAAKLLEQALLRDVPLEEQEARGIRERLIGLYTEALGDSQKAIPHVEAVLAMDPRHERARQVAESLLENRAVAARAAAALSDAYEKVGDLSNAAAMLTLELKIVRGPRRMEAQRRLGILRQDALDDPAGALELLAPVVAGDPGDDDLRARYVSLSASLNQPLEAARLLSRALQTCRDPAVRARVSAEIGNVFMQAGDPKRAQAAFQQVISSGQDDRAVLEAARRLAELHADAGDVKQLCAALELVVKLEPEREPRHAAARRLARLCEGELNDPARAVAAYRALVDSSWADEALRKLEAICEQTGDYDGLIVALERRAERSEDPELARELRFRAAELRSDERRDRAGALEAWNAYMEVYGPSREVHARLIPLLEQEKAWDRLASVLEREVELAPEGERPALWSRLGQIRAARLEDLAGALAAFRRALELDPSERTARAAVEKLLAAGEHRLEAASILEAVYRAEAPGAGLVRVLETRGELSSEPGERLHALSEAVGIAEANLANAERALELAGRGLWESVQHDREQLSEWLTRVQRFSGELGDLAGRARHLSSALGAARIDSEPMCSLARATADALVAAGEPGQAVDVYRRALEFDPTSAELLQRIDELLAQQGDPGERLALYRAALEQEQDSGRRRELLHTIGSLQRRELQDAAAAIATYQLALQVDGRDLGAHQALVDIYSEQQDWDAVYGELERMLSELEGERRTAALIRMAEVSLRNDRPKRALGHYREVLKSADLDEAVLESIEQLARARSDAETTRAVLERRVARATDPEEQAALFERLGDVQATQLGDDAAAVESFLAGARLCEGAAADEERARRLLERVLEIVPDHRESAERLLELHARAGHWERLVRPFGVLLQISGGEKQLAAILLSLEAQAVASGQVDTFVRLVDAVLERQELEPGKLQKLNMAKARALSADPARQEEAAAVFRQLLQLPEADAAAVVEAFERFLVEAGDGAAARREDWRWLFDWRARTSPEPVSVLMTWARAEEERFGDPSAAASLYARAIEIDADRVDALAELARILVAQGEAERALNALRLLREKTDGDTRTSVDLTLAGVLLDALGRPDEALDVVEPLLAAAPADAEALRIVHRALSEPATRRRAAELLEKTSEATEDVAARAQVLETLLSISEGTPELTEARGRWYEQLLECQGDDSESVLAIALRAAEEMPGRDGLWDLAERGARRLDRPEPVAEAYERALGRELEPELAEALGRRLVEFHEEWFDDQERVIRLLDRVLTLCPAAGWAFDRLKLAFNATGRWQELFGLYDRALAAAADEAVRIELLREASMAAKDFAADADRAIAYLEQLHQLSPGDGRVEAALERLYERHGHVRPLIALLEARLHGEPSEPVSSLQARIASLWLDLCEPLPAHDLVTQMIGGAEGVPLEAVELLERLVALPASRDSVLPPPSEGQSRKKRKKATPISVRDKCAAQLRAHYESTGQTADVVRMLEVEVETAQTLQERVDRLLKIVQVRTEQLGDDAGALESQAALVRLQPEVAEHRVRLAELADRTGEIARRAELLVTVAEGLEDVALCVELFNEAGLVYEERLGEASRAIELYGRALERDATRGAAALLAARRLDPLLAQAGLAAERCTVLEQLAALESDAAAVRRAHGEAARVALEELADPDRAVSAWRARLQLDAADRDALDGLVVALDRAGRNDELVAALETRAELLDAPAARADWERIASVHAERRSDRALAIDAWRVIRERFGRDVAGFEALSTLLAAEQRWPELAELYVEEAAAETDPERRRSLYAELAVVHRDRTSDSVAAVSAFVEAELWERAIEVAGAAPADKELGRRVCERLLELSIEKWQRSAGEAAEAAARAALWSIQELSQRLLESGRHEQVVELLLRGAELPFEQKRRRAFRREAACLCSDRLGDGERAIELLRGIFAEDPRDEIAAASITRLSLLLEERGLFDEIATLWEEQARCRAEAGDAAAAAALYARAADLCEQQLGDLDRAMGDYRLGAGLGGESSLEALARIHEARGEHQRVAEVLEWLCAQSAREALAGRALRLANAYVASGQRKLARARLEQASAKAIEAGALRKRLAELYREAGEWGPLAELLAGEAARAADNRSRLSLLREAAELHVHKRAQPALAVPLLEQAVEIDPEDAKLRLRLADALKRAERYDQATSILRDQVSRYGSRRPKERALIHFALARVALAAGNRAEALAELDVATKIDPAHPGILQALARLAFEEGQLDRAERMYRALLLVLGRGDDGEGPSRAEAMLDLSEIAVRRDDPIRATEYVESAFEAALESLAEAEALEAALRARGRTELLARALETRLSIAMLPEPAARALADLVALYAAQGRDPAGETALADRARRLQSELEQAGSGDDEAWAALGRVYDWLGDTEAEGNLIEQRVQARLQSGADGGDMDPFYRLAEVRLLTPDKRDQGADLLERALELEPRYDRAQAMLVAALSSAPGNERLARLFERVARQSGSDELLADALLQVAELCGPSAASVREGIGLSERLARPELAARLLELAVAGDGHPPEDAAWLHHQLADRRAADEDLAAAVELRERAAAFEGPGEARTTLLGVAKTRMDPLDQPEAAARVYERLLEAEPADREVWEPLLSIYRKLGRSEDLVRIIDRAVPLVDSPADRSRLRLEQANVLLDRAGDVDAAAEILQEVLIEDPTQVAAAILLSSIYEKTGRHAELTELLGLQLDAAKDRQDVASIVSVSMRLGELLEQQGRIDEALDVYNAVLEWSRDDVTALRAVVRLGEAKGDGFLVADCIEAMLRGGKVEAGELRPLLERLLALRAEQSDAEGTERALELGFAALPMDDALREDLVRRYTERGDWDAVARVLKRGVEVAIDDGDLLQRLVQAYRNAGRFEQALEVIDTIIAESGPEPRLLVERAALLPELGRDGEALDDLERAYGLDPSIADLVIAAIERALSRAEGDQRRTLSLRLADVLERTGQVPEARERLSGFVKEAPKDRDLLRKIADLDARTGNWDAASLSYRKLIALEEGEALVDAALRLADACERAGRIGDAQGGIERALNVAPEHPELRARLRDVLIAVGASRDVARMLLEDAARTPDVSERLEFLLAAGEWLLTPEGDVAEAVRVLEEARALSPENVEGVVLLARAHAMVGRGEEALAGLGEVIAGHRGRRLKALAPVYREMSRIQLEQGFLSDALESLSKAYEMDVRNGTLAMELARLALEIDEADVAQRAFRSVTMMKPWDPETEEGATSDDKAEAHYQLALVAKRQGDPRKAKILVAKALVENAAHEYAQALQAELEQG